MFGKLEIFKMAQSLTSHAVARHAMIAQNIAHADTPGYKAQDTITFSNSYRSTTNGTSMRSTREGHIDQVSAKSKYQKLEKSVGSTSPNENSVSLETEMMKATEVRHQHELAISVYSTSLNILRTSLGRGR